MAPERDPTEAEIGAQALRGLLDVDSLRSAAWLAGFAGGALLILTALVAWLGTAETRLDSYWLGWATAPALLAAFGGPVLGRRLLSRHSVARWRMFVTAVMALSSAAWAFALAVSMTFDPLEGRLLAIVCLALAISLLPNLSSVSCLITQLLVQLAFALGLVFVSGQPLQELILAAGVWGALALLAGMAALYARRIQLTAADLHYQRFEASELQRRLDDDEARLREAEGRRVTLEAELAEILNLAEDASRAKTEFLATMSHEIRTPPNGILPILEMLRDTPLNGEQQKFVRTAQSSSRHLLRIINDILDFAKVESGKLQLETIEIDVRELVNSVTELMSGSARNRNLKLSTNVTASVPQVVRGDPIRLRQVLINLVSNAIKFTEEGGIRVEVSRGQTSQKEVELLFAVADTGVGMSPETADRLFQSFTQADASTTRKHGGTGLGLVICKRLVELMGGKIGVRSTLGQGSIFWFLVPLRKSVMEVPSARRNLNGIRILSLVPDERIAEQVSVMLQEWGIDEETTQEPDDAIAKLHSTAMLGESWTYELALIDGTGIEHRLPGLLAEIRSVDSLKRMHVLISVRSETLAHKLKRDYGVLIVGEILRPEPLRRILHRLFDVEMRQFGNVDPRADEIYDDLNVSSLSLDIGGEPQAPTSGEFSGQVLLVEDNPVNLGVVRKALSKLGLSCATATDGKEALLQFGKQRFDLIFMDCQMPVMDGYEATHKIRRIENADGLPPTPIIAMTANAMAGDREKCINSGMDDYLPKPVSLERLRSCIASWLTTTDRLPQRAPLEVPPLKQRRTEGKPVLDEKVLRELREIMDDDYIGLLRTYLRNAPQLLEQARSAIEQADIAALVNPVHSLKSSSANVGAMELSELAREAERQARQGDLAAAGVTFEAVEVAFIKAEAALKELVAGYSPA